MNAIPVSTRSTASSLGHMPQLDGLRALAVFAVLIHHYTNSGFGVGARLGVKLFFVLSGFLITSLLLRSRDAVGVSRRQSLLNFYARRFLRIFPLYYFVVGVALMLGVEEAWEYAGWLLTYTLNIKMAQQGWYIAHFAHFWTLCVEEHFYLLWPFVVLFAPRRWLLTLGIGFILIGPLYRIYQVIAWEYFDSLANGYWTEIFTPVCFDTLGLGSVMAIMAHEGKQKTLQTLLRRVALPLGLGGLLVVEFVVGNGLINLIFFDVTAGLLFCWLTYFAGQGFVGLGGKFLELRPLRYVGRISYGVYVYHLFTPAILAYAWARLGRHFSEFTWIGFASSTIVTLAIASLSWHVFERPLNDLKRFFRDTPRLNHEGDENRPPRGEQAAAPRKTVEVG